MSPDAVFALLLLTFVAWIALPLLPAIMELVRPRDAAPLNAVGNDSGQLTYFATSFLRRVTDEGLLGTMVPPRLSDGSVVRVHAATTPLGANGSSVRDLAVLFDDTPLPDNLDLESECFARMTVRTGRAVTFRALLGQRDIVLGPDSTVLRWVHARGVLQVATGTALLGRATAERAIVLATGVRFERLEADVVRVEGAEPTEVQVRPTASYQAFVPQKALLMAPNYWRVDDDVTIPPGSAVMGSIISRGNIILGEGSRVQGSLKARGELRIMPGCTLSGAVSARGRVVIDAGSRVSGPVISETEIILGNAIVGTAGARTTITAPQVRMSPGATVYGAVMAADSGLTIV
jgi:cytoskeletal protein CcmA (bactofilin family)